MSTLEWHLVDAVKAYANATRVLSWQPVRAPHGSGSILLGPHEAGAQGLAPPGVVLPLDESNAESVQGWRHAVWDEVALRHGCGIRDRPTHLGHETFLYVAIAVQLHTPKHRSWLERQVRQHLGNLRALIACSTLDGDTLRDRQHERDDLLIDAAHTFGPEWLCANTTVGWCPNPSDFGEAGCAHPTFAGGGEGTPEPLRTSDRDPDPRRLPHR